MLWLDMNSSTCSVHLVQVTLVGLPAGYTVQPGNVAADEEKFQLIARASKEATESVFANIRLRVISGENPLLDTPVKLKVAAP